MPQHILVVLGDAGATDYFLAAREELMKKYSLRIVADPKGAAAEKLAKNGVAHVISARLPDVLLRDVSLVLCGTAGKAQELWKHATKAARCAGVPCAWFGDFFGSGCETAMKDFTPDRVTFFDESSMRQFLKQRPSFNTKGAVRIVGNPSYDAVATFDVQKHRVEARERIVIQDGETLVVYSASSLTQFDIMESMRALVPWVRRNAFLLGVSFHPADEKSAAEEVSKIRRYLQEEYGAGYVGLQDVRGLPLAAAADVFVTDYSTEGIRSALLGVPTAFLLLPSVAKYQESRGGTHPFFPILDGLGGEPAAMGVFAHDDCYRLLSLLLKKETPKALSCARMQPRFRTLADGEATRRFLDFVHSCI
jgi:hypothetical protein